MPTRDPMARLAKVREGAGGKVWNVDLRGDRSLTLRHLQDDDRPLHDSAAEVLKHAAQLWSFGVNLESVNSKGEVVASWTVPAPAA